MPALPARGWPPTCTVVFLMLMRFAIRCCVHIGLAVCTVLAAYLRFTTAFFNKHLALHVLRSITCCAGCQLLALPVDSCCPFVAPHPPLYSCWFCLWAGAGCACGWLLPVCSPHPSPYSCWFCLAQAGNQNPPWHRGVSGLGNCPYALRVEAMRCLAIHHIPACHTGYDHITPYPGDSSYWPHIQLEYIAYFPLEFSYSCCKLIFF